MARIRTIKPELPQSESLGKLSREARLLFILLWTVVDDEGKARAASRMLASLLYPYDDDAPGLIPAWLDELDASGHIRRYVVDGSTYLEVCNWLKHQKIDRPSKSRLPPFDEGSRIIAKAREASSTDLGPRTLDQGPRTKDAAPNGAHLKSSATEDADLYRRGKEILGLNAGGVIKKLVRAKNGNLALARSALEMAATKHDPREYIGAIIRGRDSPDEEARLRGDVW